MKNFVELPRSVSFIAGIAAAIALCAASTVSAQGTAPLGLKPVAQPSRISLDAAFTQAVQLSWDLRIASARGAEADARLKQAWAGLWPSVSLGADYTYTYPEVTASFSNQDQLDQQALLFNSIADITEGSAAQTPDPLKRRAAQERAQQLRQAATDIQNTNTQEIVIVPAHAATAQVQLSWPILSPRSLPLLQAAYAGVDLSRSGLRVARGQIMFAVARAYFQVVVAKRIVGIANAQLTSTAHHKEVAHARKDAGYLTDLQFQRAELDLARAEAQVKGATSALSVAKGALGMLIGANDDFDVDEAPVLLAVDQGSDADALVSTALTARDDIALQRSALEIADKFNTEAWTRFLPTVRLVAAGRYTTNTGGFSSEPVTGTLGVQASIPIFDGGMTYAQTLESRAKVTQELLRVRQLEMQVEQEVRGAVNNVAHAKVAMESAQKILDLARAQQDNAARLFDAGAVTAVEVEDANVGAFSAEVDAARAGLDVQIARLSLAHATGQFTPTAADNDARPLTNDDAEHARALMDNAKAR